MENIINEIKKRNYKVNQPTNIGEYSVHIQECYRHNGTSNNVNYEVRYGYKTGMFSWMSVNCVKIPMNASTKVINNRLNKLFGEIK